MALTVVIYKIRARILESGICAKGRTLKKLGGKKNNLGNQLIAILFGKWQVFVYDQKSMRINVVGEKYDKSTFSPRFFQR